MKKVVVLLALLLMGGIKADHKILSYEQMETEYEEFHLVVEAMWYKVPAMDIIEASVTLEEDADSCLYPIFLLRYPDGEKTYSANIPLEGEDCLGEVDSVSVKFYIWCHDFGGWSIFVFSDEENVFERIGRTELDFPVGEWAVIVVDRETGSVVAELPLYVAISKPTGMSGRLSAEIG